MSVDPLQVFNLAFLTMLLGIAIAIVRVRSLYAAVMFAGAYSLVSAVWFLVQDAADVAFTEAAVGAGISTVLMLGAMLLTAREARRIGRVRRIAAATAAVAAGAVLLLATPDLAPYGVADTPANAGVGLEYLERTGVDTHVPNVVTAVLASYRGFDTLGEVAVVVTAGIAVLMLLGVARGRRADAAKDRP